MRRAWLEFRYLFAVQVLEQRSWFAGTLFLTTAFPLLLVYGVGIVGDGQSAAALTYIITGSAVVSLTTIGISMVAQDLAGMKERGKFVYYASLPISKSSLLLAVVMAKLLLQMPGIVVSLVSGSLIYGLGFGLDPLLLLILPLAALALSGIGAALGLLAPSFEVVNVLSQVALIFVMFAAPVRTQGRGGRPRGSVTTACRNSDHPDVVGYRQPEEVAPLGHGRIPPPRQGCLLHRRSPAASIGGRGARRGSRRSDGPVRPAPRYRDQRAPVLL